MAAQNKYVDSTEKSRKRYTRILRMIAGGPCLIEPSSSQNIAVINVVGSRRVKCEIRVLQHWLQLGYLSASSKSDGTHLVLTPNGRKYCMRQSDGEVANQHRNLVEKSILTENTTQTVTVNTNESPLSRLFHRRCATKTDSWLDEVEFSAGERLRADFEFSHLSPKVTASWDPTANIASGKGGRRPAEGLTDRAIDARNRLNSAVEAVGPELSSVLVDFCCYLKGLEQIEMEKRWPRRSAKLVLKLALAALARHYAPPPKNGRLKTRHWGADGYRPEL